MCALAADFVDFSVCKLIPTDYLESLYDIHRTTQFWEVTIVQFIYFFLQAAHYHTDIKKEDIMGKPKECQEKIWQNVKQNALESFVSWLNVQTSHTSDTEKILHIHVWRSCKQLVAPHFLEVINGCGDKKNHAVIQELMISFTYTLIDNLHYQFITSCIGASWPASINKHIH
jgi:hypothetical protein